MCHTCHLLLFIVDGAELLQALHTAASRLKSKGWAVSNKKTYQAQLTCYLDFCAKVNLSGVPASPKQIILYIAYMVDVKSFKYSTIKNYLNIVKHLHCANDFDGPIHPADTEGSKTRTWGCSSYTNPALSYFTNWSSLCLDLKEDLSF